MSFEDRSELYAGVGLFFAVLKDQACRHIERGPEAGRASSGATRDSIPAPTAFLKRAAVLHSDAAIYNDYPMVRAGRIPHRRRSPGAAVHPLLFESPAHARQGRRDPRAGESRTGTGRSPGACWTCSRPSLLTIRSSSTWYHATSALHARKRSVRRSDAALAASRRSCCPTMRTMLFDRAVTPEIHGTAEEPGAAVGRRYLPAAVPPHWSAYPAADGRRRGRARHSAGGGDQRGSRAIVPAGSRSIRTTSRRASAWRGCSNCASATTRRRRNWPRRWRRNPPVSSRITRISSPAARRRRSDGSTSAMAHYREASALFPGAQSALLAESQAALLGADVPATLAPIEHLDQSSTARDPWWPTTSPPAETPTRSWPTCGARFRSRRVQGSGFKVQGSGP